MLDKWKSLPIPVQWILYVPAVISITILFSILIKLIFFRALDPDYFFSIRSYLIGLVEISFFTIIYVKLSLDLAPKKKFLLAWLMFLLYSLLHILGISAILYYAFTLPDSFEMKSVLEISYSLIWFALGVICLIGSKEDEAEPLNKYL